MTNKIVTIHQPDFMPWLGLFNKINNADEFIILNHVLNNPKSANFWCRRVNMLIGGKAHWMSITLAKNNGNVFIPINTMEFCREENAIKKFKLSIENNYKKAPFFNEVFYLIDYYFELKTNNISELNTWFIKEVSGKLGIKTNFICSSDLSPRFSSNEMLIDLLIKREATTYLCGGGASGYQKDELFAEKGIKVLYNNFSHPTYNQYNSKEFIPGLSIIDCLMNIGFNETSKIVGVK